MALKIRLRQQGKKNYTVYRLVLTDVRSKRDGKYVEALGWYNPYPAVEAQKASFEGAKIAEWLHKGAVPTEKALQLIRRFCPEVMAEYIKRRAHQVEKRREEAKGRRA